MHWPGDHPARTDPALAAVAGGADELCPDAVVCLVLRHVPGRRVTSLVTIDGERAVLKVFASPRARGNDRRLRALAASRVADLVPTPLGADATGHVGLVSYRAGTVLDRLADDRFVVACAQAGHALRRLHRSRAPFDRTWTIHDEVRQLVRRAPSSLTWTVEAVTRDADEMAGAPLVPSHRDCHPRQLVVSGDDVAWIDLDDCAVAPAGLDVGNMLAHLRRERVLRRRSDDVLSKARCAFVSAYCDDAAAPADLDRWEALSVVRLAGLAETRHRSIDERDALYDELQLVGAMPAAGRTEASA